MTIVVGYLPTEEGRAALSAAAREAERRSARVVVVASDKSRAPDREFQDADLDEIRDALVARSLGHEIRHISRGRDVSEDLLQTAHDVAAELIVVGLRRRSAVGKLLLGSNVQRVLIEATCPVLVVKPHRE